MGKSITDWQNEITAWGAEKGWDKPALCARKGLTQREYDLVRLECGEHIASQMRPVGAIHHWIRNKRVVAQYVQYQKREYRHGGKLA